MYICVCVCVCVCACTTRHAFPGSDAKTDREAGRHKSDGDRFSAPRRGETHCITHYIYIYVNMYRCIWMYVHIYITKHAIPGLGVVGGREMGR